MTEYTGQLMGGPDNGNLVSATVQEITTQVSYIEYLDGADNRPSVTTVHGKYVWMPLEGVFRWQRGAVSCHG